MSAPRLKKMRILVCLGDLVWLDKPAGYAALCAALGWLSGEVMTAPASWDLVRAWVGICVLAERRQIGAA